MRDNSTNKIFTEKWPERAAAIPEHADDEEFTRAIAVGIKDASGNIGSMICRLLKKGETPEEAAKRVLEGNGVHASSVARHAGWGWGHPLIHETQPWTYVYTASVPANEARRNYNNPKWVNDDFIDFVRLAAKSDNQPGEDELADEEARKGDRT